MARRVTQEDIKLINDTYYSCKSYAETARRTGWTPSTVSRYVDKNYRPVLSSDITRFDFSEDAIDPCTLMITRAENLGELCVLTQEEVEEIKELWKEIAI